MATEKTMCPRTGGEFNSTIRNLGEWTGLFLICDEVCQACGGIIIDENVLRKLRYRGFLCSFHNGSWRISHINVATFGPGNDSGWRLVQQRKAPLYYETLNRACVTNLQGQSSMEVRATLQLKFPSLYISDEIADSIGEWVSLGWSDSLFINNRNGIAVKSWREEFFSSESGARPHRDGAFPNRYNSRSKYSCPGQATKEERKPLVADERAQIAAPISSSGGMEGTLKRRRDSDGLSVPAKRTNQYSALMQYVQEAPGESWMVLPDESASELPTLQLSEMAVFGDDLFGDPQPLLPVLPLLSELCI